MNLQTIRTNPWPYAIIGWFLLFGSGMAAWVVVAVRNDPELVRSDYYEQEIAYQKQIDRLSRTAAMQGEVSVAYDFAQRHVTLQIPAAHLSTQVKGQIHFYRPSDAALDFQVPLAVDAAGLQSIGTESLRGGRWKVRVQWNAAGHDYFFEQVMVADEASPGLTTPPTKAK